MRPFLGQGLVVGLYSELQESSIHLVLLMTDLQTFRSDLLSGRAGDDTSRFLLALFGLDPDPIENGRVVGQPRREHDAVVVFGRLVVVELGQVVG